MWLGQLTVTYHIKSQIPIKKSVPISVPFPSQCFPASFLIPLSCHFSTHCPSLLNILDSSFIHLAICIKILFRNTSSSESGISKLYLIQVTNDASLIRYCRSCKILKGLVGSNKFSAWRPPSFWSPGTGKKDLGEFFLVRNLIESKWKKRIQISWHRKERSRFDAEMNYLSIIKLLFECYMR